MFISNRSKCSGTGGSLRMSVIYRRYALPFAVCVLFGCGGDDNGSTNENINAGDGGIFCDPGEFLGCDGEDLILCASSGTGSTRVACGPAGCSEMQERCNECDPSEPDGCEGDRRVQCSEDGLALDSELCPWGCRISNDGSLCNDCRPDSVECHDATHLVSCNGEGQVLNEEQCQFGCAVDEGRCNECEPLTVACAGGDLTACDPDGLVEQVEHCENGCDPEALECQCLTHRCIDDWTLLRCGYNGLTAGTELCLNGCSEESGNDRCNECFPGSVTCDGEDVRTCGADGQVASVEQCAMGCDQWETPGRCRSFAPRYVSVASLDIGTDDFEPAVDVVIDTTAETIIGTSGSPPPEWTPPAITIAQPHGPDIWVVHFHDVTITSPQVVRVVGDKGLALVASGRVSIQLGGIIDASGHGPTAGAGGRHAFSAAWGGSGGPPDGLGGPALNASVCEQQRPSGGGGAHSGAGGSGGSTYTGGDTVLGGAGGAIIGSTQMQELLGGGCGGGTAPYDSNAGAGGGVLIITAKNGIEITSFPSWSLFGRIDVSGGGGQNRGTGGGAGGSVFLEAPIIEVDGLLRAVGGGGACGDQDGAGSDGYDTGNGCDPSGGGHANGGDGGYSDNRQTSLGGGNGTTGLCGSSSGYSAGGGGGAAGHARFRVANDPSNLTITNNASLLFAPCSGSQASCVDVFTPF